jgi:type IV secretion system protein VirD4
MTRLLILVLFSAPLFGQSLFNARADAETAANWRHVMDLREAEFREGKISREKLDKDKAQAEAIIARLRQKNAESPLKEAFEKEYASRLKMLRGETDWGAVAGSTWTSLKEVVRSFGVFLPVLFWTGVSAAGLALIVGAFKLVFALAAERKAEQEAQKMTPPPVTTTHGSASWEPQMHSLPEGIWRRGVFLGKSSTPEIERMTPLERDPGAPVYSSPENHVLIVARTRTGKGTRIIIPTLTKYSGSMLVIDPKGENAAVTARERKRRQENVYILNPWNELGDTFRKLGFSPVCYNPLDLLDRGDPNAVAIAQSLAGAICPSDGKGKDSYWSQSAASVLTAVLLYLADDPREKKTLARARQLVSLTRKQFTEYLVRMAASEAFDGAIRENAAPFIDLAQETYSGVMSNLAQHTKWLSDPQIKAATSSSTFAMADMVREPATVYLVIPPDRMDTQRTWLRLMIAAGMHTFKRARDRGPHRCMFLIDEFPALGRLDDLPRDIATMAGYGVDFTLIVQGIDQLKDVYGDAHTAILSNCAYKWFCNVNDLGSAEYLSKTLGKGTVSTTSKSVGEKESYTHSETGRELLTPDEILTLGRDAAILLQPGTKPVYLRPVDYWKLASAFATYRNREPYMYWQPLWEPPSPQFDPNPYHVRG